MFACEHRDVVPDILTVAKGINSGYVLLGAMVVNEILDWVKDKPFAGGLTYSATPRARRRSRPSRRSRRKASSRTRRRTASTSRSSYRGSRSGTRRSATCGARGLLFGLELVTNRETREPLVLFNAAGDAAAPVNRMAKAAPERGLYLFVHWNVVIIAPPLTITREELDEGLGILDEVLAIADEYAT